MFRTQILVISLVFLASACGISKDKYAALEDQLRECQNAKSGALTAQQNCEGQLQTVANKKDELEKKTETYEDLVHSLKGEIDAGKVKISQMKDRLTVNLIDKILFDSGKAVVNQEGVGTLKKVADVLKGVEDKRIQVEGYTDNVPVGPALQAKFPTNWELSTRRATAVVHELAQAGVAEAKMSATGYGMNRPVASNESEDGRKQNRRIEIVLVPELQAAPAPAPEKAEEAKTVE